MLYKYTPGLSFIMSVIQVQVEVHVNTGDMQVGEKICKYVQLAQMLATILHLGCLTTSPGLTRSSGQPILLEPGKWFAFLNKNPQRGRDGTHGNEVGTLRRDIEIYIDR